MRSREDVEQLARAEVRDAFWDERHGTAADESLAPNALTSKEAGTGGARCEAAAAAALLLACARGDRLEEDGERIISGAPTTVAATSALPAPLAPRPSGVAPPTLAPLL